MLILIWRLSAKIRLFLLTYMPTNILLGRLEGLGVLWTLLAAGLLAPSYLLLLSLCATLVAAGGPDYLNVVVLLCFWNAVKFIWVGVLCVPLILRRTRSRRATTGSS